MAHRLTTISTNSTATILRSCTGRTSWSSPCQHRRSRSRSRRRSTSVLVISSDHHSSAPFFHATAPPSPAMNSRRRIIDLPWLDRQTIAVGAACPALTQSFLQCDRRLLARCRCHTRRPRRPQLEQVPSPIASRVDSGRLRDIITPTKLRCNIWLGIASDRGGEAQRRSGAVVMRHVERGSQPGTGPVVPKSVIAYWPTYGWYRQGVNGY